MGRTKSCKKESKCSAGNGLTPSLGPRGGGVWWSSWRMWSWREMEIFVNNIFLNMYSNKSHKSTHPSFGQWGWGEERHHRECDLGDFMGFHFQACVFNNCICLNQISLMTTSTATEYNERRSSESSTSSCCEAQLPADRPPSTISLVDRVPPSMRVQPSCSQHQDPS